MELDKDFKEFVGLLNANEVEYLIVGLFPKKEAMKIFSIVDRLNQGVTA